MFLHLTSLSCNIHRRLRSKAVKGRMMGYGVGCHGCAPSVTRCSSVPWVREYLLSIGECVYATWRRTYL